MFLSKLNEKIEEFFRRCHSSKAQESKKNKEVFQIEDGYKEIINFIIDFSKRSAIETLQYSKSNIEEFHNFVFEKFIPLLDRMNIFEDEYNFFKEIVDSYNRWEKIQKKPWLKDKAVIALLGKFSGGKSSIVNSLLGDKLLPVDVTPTTAIPTYISFSPQEDIKAIAIDNDEEKKEIPLENIKNIAHDKLKDFPLSMFIKYFVISYNNENLKDKSILDTPGYDSLKEKDKRRTIEAIDESDAILWVMDINDGTIKADALKFIKENVKNKPFYVIINKADQKSPKEREMTLKEVENTFTKNEITYKMCILYSTKENEEFNQYKEEFKKIIKSIEKQQRLECSGLIKKAIDDAFDELKKKIIQCKMEKNQLERLVNKKISQLMIEKITQEIKDLEEYRHKLQELNELYNQIFL
jgi:predicted GTPase